MQVRYLHRTGASSGRKPRLRTSRSPSSTRWTVLASSAPTGSPRSARSTVISWLTLTVQSRSRLAVPATSGTLPGVAAARSLVVTAATIAARIQLRLKRSLDTISTGRR